MVCWQTDGPFHEPTATGPDVNASEQLMVKHTVDGDVVRPVSVFTPGPDRRPLVRPNGTASRMPRVPFMRPLHDIACAQRTLEGELGGS
jgi:hypothetical protein